MKIQFHLQTDMQPLYYGEKLRYSSMTSVALISNHMLACASYCMREMYLVEFDFNSKTCSVLDKITTRGGRDGQPGATDLMCYRENSDGTHILITSDFQHCSVSFYEITKEKTLRYIKSVTNEVCSHCHGVSFYPGDDNVVFFTTTGTKNPFCGIYAFRLDKSDSGPFFGLAEPGWLGKDVTFADDKTMIGLYCKGAPNPIERRDYATKIVVYRVDVHGNCSKKLDEKVVEHHHADSCTFDAGHVYVTTEGTQDEGRVMVCSVDILTGKLEHVGNIKGYAFPHGIDLNSDFIAVTEYGTNTVDIRHRHEKNAPESSQLPFC